MLLFFRNARLKMCCTSPDEPSVVKARAGLLWLQKTETVQDEKVDGDYGLVINGHSLVKKTTKKYSIPSSPKKCVLLLFLYS